MLELLKGIAGLLAGVFSVIGQQTTLRNTPAMVAAKQNQRLTDLQDRLEKAIAKNDVDEIRKIIAA